MFLISQGTCKVHLSDRNDVTLRLEDINIRTLGRDTYFGEVSLFHDSIRTANVTAMSYATTGQIQMQTLYNICSNFPSFRQALFKRMQVYDDPLRCFLHAALRRVSYLKHAKEETISMLAFSLKNDWLEKGSMIFDEKDTSNCLIIIHDGIVELQWSMFQKKEVITLERLSKGAVLNPNNFLVQEKLKIRAFCKTNVSIFVIDRQKFTQIVLQDELVTNLIQ